MSKTKITCPKVYCPKEKRYVEIWWCIGSFMQQKKPCPHGIKAKVEVNKNKAKVKCGWKKKMDVVEAIHRFEREEELRGTAYEKKEAKK